MLGINLPTVVRGKARVRTGRQTTKENRAADSDKSTRYAEEKRWEDARAALSLRSRRSIGVHKPLENREERRGVGRPADEVLIGEEILEISKIRGTGTALYL